MARTVTKDALEAKIEKAQMNVIKTKAAYEKANDALKDLLDKRDALLNEVTVRNAPRFCKSERSFVLGRKFQEVNTHTTKTYYSSLHVKQWDFTVHGEFTYTGKSAKAVSSSCKYKIYTSGWKCKSHSATKSGSKALAKGIFQKNNTNKTVNIGLSCSPTGKISAI